MKKAKTPPLGIKPKFICEEERLIELKQAIDRFLQANWPIPDSITSEYNEICSKLLME